MIEKKKLSTILAITEIIVGLIVLVDVLFFRDVQNIFSSVLIVAGIISFLSYFNLRHVQEDKKTDVYQWYD